MKYYFLCLMFFIQQIALAQNVIIEPSQLGNIFLESPKAKLLQTQEIRAQLQEKLDTFRWDPVLKGSSQWNDANQKQNSWDVLLSQNTPWGSYFSLGYSDSTSKTTHVQVGQNLLKDSPWWGDLTSAIAQIEAMLDEVKRNQQIEQGLESILLRYLDVIEAQESLVNRTVFLSTAEKNFQEMTKAVEKGYKARSELLAFEESVLLAQQNKIEGERYLQTQKSLFCELTNNREQCFQWQFSTNLNWFDSLEKPLSLDKKTFEQMQKNLEKEILLLQKQKKQKDNLPELSVSWKGTKDEKIKFSQLIAIDFSMQIGSTFERTELAKKAQEIIILEREQETLNIATQTKVNSFKNDRLNAEDELKIANKLYNIQEKRYKAEEEKFDAGRSTSSELQLARERKENAQMNIMRRKIDRLRTTVKQSATFAWLQGLILNKNQK